MYDVTADRASQFHGDPLIADSVVYVGTDGEAGYVYAFDRRTGAVLWKSAADKVTHGNAGFPTDILQSGSLLYTAGIGDDVVSLNRADGSAKWKFRSSGSGEQRFSNSAAIGSGRLFLAALDGILYALDVNTGRVAWKREFNASFSTAVVVDREDLIVGAANKRLYRVRQSDGSVVATLDLPTPPAYTPVILGDTVFVITAEELFAVRSSLSGISWSRKAGKEWSTPRVRIWNGAVVAGDGPILYALDVRSGKELWKQHLGGTIRGIGSDQDVLYVGTLSGDIYAFRPPRSP